MRQIKFRGKRPDGSKWITGSMIRISGLTFIFPDPAPDGFDRYVVDPATVGQFTGLLDKNGKEIYEGDVLQEIDSGRKVAIEWVDFHWGFSYTHNDFGYIWPNHTENFIIIGNIHDNSELLKTE